MNNFEHVYFPLAATVQNDSQIDEPEIRQAPALNEGDLGLRREAPKHLTGRISVTDASFP